MLGDVPRPYMEWDAIFRDCPECGVGAEQFCRNPITKEPRAIPCVARTKPEEIEQ